MRQSSDRTFGLVFAAFFLVVALLPVVRGGEPRVWALPVSAAFGLVALMAPRVLGPLNLAWTVVGRVLHRVTNPIVLGVLFFGVITPFGWVLRALGNDFLGLKRRAEGGTYWIGRQPPGPAPETIANQF